MVSRIFKICDAYESGVGHGLQRDGHKDGKAIFADAELAEAYEIGYELGDERSTKGAAKGEIFPLASFTIVVPPEERAAV
jgi:hypothetical protein